tara:strand:- start:556 stop:945 length:390 start_codon:yes stop_codon:yes gene_type:complete
MSTLKVNTIQNTSGGSSSTPEQIEQGRAKVWINFNGSGTVAIRDSFNISSLTDNGTGDYSLNYSDAFSNDDYCLAGTAGYNAEFIANHLNGGGQSTTYSTSSCRFSVRHVYNNNLSDANHVEVMIIGDS